jgi:hypothetical protein
VEVCSNPVVDVVELATESNEGFLSRQRMSEGPANRWSRRFPKLDRSAVRFVHLHIENLVEQKDHAGEAPSEADPNSRKCMLSNRVYCRFPEDIDAIPLTKRERSAGDSTPPALKL